MIERAGRILIAQRGPGSHLALLWEFPGGKREPGETWEECLARELDEELGVTADVGSWLDGVTHEYRDRHVRLRFYRCRLVRGEPAPLRCHAVRWVRPAQLPRFAFPEADAGLVAWLAARSHGRRGGDVEGLRRRIVRVAFDSGAVAQILRGSSLEAAAERCGADLPFGCRTGDCGVCAVRVVSGAARLSAPTPAELAFQAEAAARSGPSERRPARSRGAGTLALRLACQARALGDVTVARVHTSDCPPSTRSVWPVV